MANNRNSTPQPGYQAGNPNDRIRTRGNSDTEMENDDPSSSRKRAKEDFDFRGLPAEMVEVLLTQMGKLEMAVTNTLSKNKPQGSENKAWASEWKTERLWISAPVSGISVDGSLIDQVILSLVTTAPTRVTITAGKGAESLPVLSIEDERFLTGILSAFRGVTGPSSLRCGSSSIIDLTFYALWNLSAARLVNDKDRRNKIHPSVLPDKPIRGGKASEFIASRIVALKATLGSEYSYIGDTIERVIKVWTDVSCTKTRHTLSNIKIPWGLVLSKGGEFRIAEKRQGRQRIAVRQLKTPLNPKESAWIMPAERRFIGHLTSPIWKRVDDYQKDWANLNAGDTHVLFDSYVDKIRLAYKEMHRVSESLNKRLGMRKSVILNSPAARQLTKKDRKNLKSNDLLILFSKTDLSKTPKGAKAIFEPLFVASCLDAAEQIIAALKTHNVETFKPLYNELKDNPNDCVKVLARWENWWVETFQPANETSPADVPKDALQTENMFASIQDMDIEGTE